MSFVTTGLVILAGLVVALLLIFLAKRRREAGEIAPKRDGRGMRKKAPFFRREIVKRKVTSLFPGPASAEILDILDAALPTTQGLERLQLALLKLSDGNVDELRRLVQNVTSESGLKTCQDIRIIARAEWPEADRMSYNYLDLLPQDQEPIFRRDLRQYLRWVKR